MLLGDEEVLIVLGLFVIGLAILVIIAIINQNSCIDYPDQCKYIDSMEVNTGDIVLVSYPNVSGGLISAFSKSVWSHTGMIWVDPLTDIRYVLEGAIYRYKKYQHFFKIPFETWLYFNRKFILGYKKYYGPPINSDFLWSKFEWMVKNCKLDKFNIFWARFLADKDYYEYSKSPAYSCLEASVILGQDAGIFYKDKIYCSYFPGDIANNRITLCKGIKYDLPIQISIHPSNHMLIAEDIFFHQEMWKN